ncbi:MAG: hypothetical protein E3J35_08895 [Methanomassiliicoccales archaeon]|nr:MAG: hypothetical protein E3J35_08895 [Methanomassiliicoccales archaeon]
MPKRPLVDEGNLTEEYPRVQERIQKRQDISTVKETEGSVSIAGDIAARSEHGRISTTRLRRLVMARLPPSSVLREVLLAESEKLSVEEFLAKLDIWLLLFRKDAEG